MIIFLFYREFYIFTGKITIEYKINYEKNTTLQVMREHKSYKPLKTYKSKGYIQFKAFSGFKI